MRPRIPFFRDVTLVVRKVFFSAFRKKALRFIPKGQMAEVEDKTFLRNSRNYSKMQRLFKKIRLLT